MRCRVAGEQELEMPEMIGISEIAERLEVGHTTVRRLIDREADSLGVKIHRDKGNRVLLSRNDAENLIASYLARLGPQPDSPEEGPKYDRFGFFYIIQLVPEALPGRVKLGFAENVERRLIEHRTAAPTANLLKAWPCKRSWDYAAMDSVTRTDCQLVLNEVYEGSIQGFLERAEQFFALMPDPDTKRDLSKYSPMFTPNDNEE